MQQAPPAQPGTGVTVIHARQPSGGTNALNLPAVLQKLLDSFPDPPKVGTVPIDSLTTPAAVETFKVEAANECLTGLVGADLTLLEKGIREENLPYPERETLKQVLIDRPVLTVERAIGHVHEMIRANKISAATSKLLGKGSIPEIRLSKVFVDFGYDSHKQAPTNRPLIDEVTVTNVSKDKAKFKVSNFTEPSTAITVTVTPTDGTIKKACTLSALLFNALEIGTKVAIKDYYKSTCSC